MTYRTRLRDALRTPLSATAQAALDEAREQYACALEEFGLVVQAAEVRERASDD